MPNPNFTTQDLLNQVQVELYNDPSGVVEGTQNYKLYLAKLNIYISEHENERDVLWNELYTLVENAVTITAGLTTINLPDDFKTIGGKFIKLALPTGQVIWRPAKMLPESLLNIQNNLKEFYVEGNPVDGYQLVLGWTPQAGDLEVGAKVSYVYYRTEPQLAGPADVPTMTNPLYLVHATVADAALVNGNNNLTTVAGSRAANAMAMMKATNESGGYYMDNKLPGVERRTGRASQVPNRLWSGYWMGM